MKRLEHPLKDPQNYELYNYTELGRGEPELVESGREICSGEYGGILGFRHIMGKMAVTFADAEEAGMNSGIGKICQCRGAKAIG